MKLSIIVCTHNRSYAITQCLDSIVVSLRDAAPVEAEIIVVDNASTDDTSAVVSKWAGSCNFPVQLLHEPKKGLSAARNCALRNAKGDLLAFTDDDCRLSKNYVAEALRHDATDMQPVLRGGRVELGDPADLEMTIQTYPTGRYWYRPENVGKYMHLGSGMILGCNMTMRKELAGRIGYFDERIGAGTSIPSAEDTDYIYRAYLSDIKVEYVPDMAVFHFHGRRTADEAKKLLRNYATGAGALYAKYLYKHPNLRGKFYRNSSKRRAAAGASHNLSHVDISREEKLVCALRGALRYFYVSMRKAVR